MITKLTIRNFQAHGKLEVDLDPHVTTVVGQSDKGKSAVLRALRWAALNQPGGEAFIKDGEDKASVSVEIRTATGPVTVTRTKGKGTNTYHLGDKEFKAFGSDVPPEISAAFNVTALNFQGQHDGPFWFSETAGEVSRRLNEIINLGVIDSVLGHLGSKVRDATARAALAEERVAAAKAERARLDMVGEIDEALKHVEGLGTIASEARLRASELVELVKNVSKYGARQENALKQATSALAVVALGDRLVELSTKVGNLLIQVRGIRRLKPLADRKFPDLSRLEKLGEQVKRLDEKAEALRDMLRSVYAATEIKNQAEARLRRIQSDFDKQLGTECPLCGQPMK